MKACEGCCRVVLRDGGELEAPRFRAGERYAQTGLQSPEGALAAAPLSAEAAAMAYLAARRAGPSPPCVLWPRCPVGFNPHSRGPQRLRSTGSYPECAGGLCQGEAVCLRTPDTILIVSRNSLPWITSDHDRRRAWGPCLKHAQHLAALRTTKLYDRRQERVSLDEVERTRLD